MLIKTSLGNRFIKKSLKTIPAHEKHVTVGCRDRVGFKTPWKNPRKTQKNSGLRFIGSCELDLPKKEGCGKATLSLLQKNEGGNTHHNEKVKYMNNLHAGIVGPLHSSFAF